MKKDCDCLSKTKEKIVEHVIKENADANGFKIIESDWEHRSWYPKVRLYSNFIIKNTFIKKDGSESKPKNSHVSIYYTYCPFCGKKFEDNELRTV